MTKLYKVVTLYEEGKLPRYHVVNIDTKQIQSSWDSWSKALEIKNDLNRQIISNYVLLHEKV